MWQRVMSFTQRYPNIFPCEKCERQGGFRSIRFADIQHTRVYTLLVSDCGTSNDTTAIARQRLPKYATNLYVCSYLTKKLHGLNPQANYTDRATAACQQS
jgi:uncharacterized protein VirK/YbjX